MCILEQERPQNVHYTDGVLDLGDPIKYNVSKCKFCIKCKHSVPNNSFPKDEVDNKKTFIKINKKKIYSPSRQFCASELTKMSTL